MVIGLERKLVGRTLILGGGMTGLAAGIASGWPVFEAAESPGGICSSYYVRPGETARFPSAPEDGEAYRFELGGGHWIFGGDPTILRFLDRLAPVARYARRSAVFFPDQGRFADYPIQNNLRGFPPELACRALTEMARPPAPFRTMKDWLLQAFGPTLCETFFFPFHQLYTAGLYSEIAPQDAYKSPVDLSQVIQGMFQPVEAVGYNVTFAYPIEGLNHLSQAMARQCEIHFGKRVVRIDPQAKTVDCDDGSIEPYETLLCTLPLNQTMAMTGLRVEAEPDPYTSVLVLNLGAKRGPRCPAHHWLYHPATRSGFHRVGFYSNVDRSFLPRSAREQASAVSIYVERAYPGGHRPPPATIQAYAQNVVEELTSWGFIAGAEVVDPTWIDVAYTWQWPGSPWKPQALQELQNHDIFMIGRYARWQFQGIADSIKDGFYAGSSFKKI